MRACARITPHRFFSLVLLLINKRANTVEIRDRIASAARTDRLHPKCVHYAACARASYKICIYIWDIHVHVRCLCPLTNLINENIFGQFLCGWRCSSGLWLPTTARLPYATLHCRSSAHLLENGHLTIICIRRCCSCCCCCS